MTSLPPTDKAATTHMNAQNWPSNSGWEKLAGVSSSRHSFPARVTNLLPLHGAARPVCHGSPHSSQGSLLLPERQSPLTASPHPAPIKLSQLAGLETGAGRKKSERRGISGEMGLLSGSCSSVFCQTSLQTGRMSPQTSPESLQPQVRHTAFWRSGSCFHLFGHPKGAQVLVLQAGSQME